jgi:hypothetical protein
MFTFHGTYRIANHCPYSKSANSFSSHGTFGFANESISLKLSMGEEDTICHMPSCC